jgi:hypothetical protein
MLFGLTYGSGFLCFQTSGRAVKNRKPKMTSDKHLPWYSTEVVSPSFYGSDTLRHAAALGLRATSALLTRMARQLVAPLPSRRSKPLPPVLEFYADSGAPEGALYVDGKLVGWLSGVKRL